MVESALVLGGGGVTGVAWEIGMLLGLAECGVELADAELIVGTSAGSVVAAQITSGTPLAELYEAQLAGYGTEKPARLGVGSLLRLSAASISHRDEQHARAAMGRVALAAHTPPEEVRRAVIAARLPVTQWPERRLLITAVAADDGEFVIFDRDSGVSLLDAVAASCAVPAVWPPVTIGPRRFIDGGMRSPANVDIAHGAARIVVLAPISRSFRRRDSVPAQVAALPEGTKVVVCQPDAAASRAIGSNPLDPSRRAAAAQAGLRQAEQEFAAVAGAWRA